MFCKKGAYSRLIYFLLLSIIFQQSVFAEDMSQIEFTENKIKALKSFEDGKYIDSYEMFMELFRERPLDGDINLAVARSAYAAKKYNQSIMAYERLIESYPKDAFLHVEIAKAYIGLGDLIEARNRLLAAKAIDPSITGADIDAMINRMESEQKKFFINGNVGVSFLYDSNANSGPLSRSIVLGDWSLMLEESATQKESLGMTGNFALNLLWRNSPESSLVYIADMAFFSKLYTESDVKDNNFLWGRIGAGIRYAWKKVYVDARLKTDFAQYPSDKNITSAGAETTAGWFISKNSSLTTRLSYDWRFYHGSEDNDGGVFSAGEYFRQSFGNHSITIGGRFSIREAQRRSLSYLSGEASLRVSASIPYGFTASPSVIYKGEWYGGPATALESKDRKDDQVRFGFSLIKQFPYSISAEVEYSYVKNYSSSNLYIYDQHTATVSINWYF